MRADVSGALLQRLAEPRREEVGILSVVASGGDVAGALVYFLGGNFVRDGYAAAAREGHRAQRDCADDNFARGGDFWVGIPVPGARIPVGLSEISLDGLAARGCAEHFGSVHDVAGRAVLAHRRGDSGEVEGKSNRLGAGSCGGSCSRDAVAVDHISSAMAAVAAGVVYQRRAHLRAAAALVIPHFPMDSIRLRGAGAGFPVVFWFRQEERSVVFCCCWRGGGDRLRGLSGGGWRGGAVVLGGGFRLLGHQARNFSDLLRGLTQP